MKALSIKQPWAWLICHGYKHVENRTWWARERGRIAIHASKSYDAEGDAWVRRTFPQIPLPSREALAAEMGGIVGEATLMGCMTSDGFPNDPWAFGPFCFVLAEARPREFVPMRGALGFFAVELPQERAK